MTNSEAGFQSISYGFLDKKIKTVDSEEFQIHSFRTSSTFSKNTESDLKEEKCDGVDGSNHARTSASTLQDG